jgi:hypothetical protein
MSESAEITVSVSPENIKKAEKLKEEANNCFKSMIIPYFLVIRCMNYNGSDLCIV